MSEADSSELIELSHAIGRHPSRMALWREGACAVKINDSQFFVSRCGANLSNLSPADLVRMDLPGTAALVSLDAVPDGAFAAAQTDPDGAPPSPDAMLFAYLFSLDKIKFAAHVHPVEINQILGSPRARQFADRRTVAHDVSVCGVSSLLVPYATPGLPLAKEVKRRLVLWRDRYKLAPRFIYLQNHGMIVLGNSRDEILGTTEMVVKSAQVFIGASLMGGPAFLTPDNVQNLEAIQGF